VKVGTKPLEIEYTIVLNRDEYDRLIGALRSASYDTHITYRKTKTKYADMAEFLEGAR
jgi:uncharacterized protein YjbK